MGKNGSCKAYEYEPKLTFLALSSDSQTLVDTQKLVGPERFWLKSNFFAHESLMSMMKRFLRESYMSLLCA